MKLLNILKNGTTKITKSSFETLDKTKLNKVIGGGNGDTLPTTVDSVRVRSHSNQNNN